MLRNYIKVAFRNLRRNKLYASLNILGLSIGLGSFFIIYLFLQNELAYDQFHEKKDRIYRVNQAKDRGYGVELNGDLTSALAPAAKESIPEIEAFSRVSNDELDIVIQESMDSLDHVKSLAVDPGFIDFFDLDFLVGSKSSSFNTPFSILISESQALRYYGLTDVLGKVIVINEKRLLVDGVFKDLPNATSLKADIIVPIKTVDLGAKYMEGPGSWRTGLGHQTYFLIRNDASISGIEQKINDLYIENSKREDDVLSLEPLANVHYSLDTIDTIPEKTDRQYVFIFSVVAGFILLCAIFNYISLALSQSIERAKEIGIRKVTGARKSQLYKQFFFESVIHVFFSFVLGIVLVEFLLPLLENLIERRISGGVFSQPVLLLKGFVFSIIVALLCSVYPAYLSTRVKVVNILKGSNNSFSSKRLIGAISVVQIIVFVVLVCVSFTANRQMHFMRNENLGFDRENQLVIDKLPRAIKSKSVVFKNQLLKTPGVQSASYFRNLPGTQMSQAGYGDYDFMFTDYGGDLDFFETMGMTMLDGRNYVAADTAREDLVVINATLAKKLGYEEGLAAGQDLVIRNESKRIIGVVNDFHFFSKKQPIEASRFYAIRYIPSMIVLKLNGENLGQTVERINEVYRKVSGGSEASFFFLDDKIDALYKQENVMITMLNTFTVIAALVAFIGLFGIAGYSVKRRLKEMGIRKVLGAGFLSIQKTLNVSSVWKLLIAVAIAVPVVVYWMDNWLSSFAYRIEMPVFLIFGAIAVASLVIFITVSIHSVKAYLINPVEILKDE
ncbi:ABC transporter permease [Roseivirga echinicomitans]|uniref:ABC transporter permease n=1 Tax=Roseivirga echinicomitans TaxID=296218 RepID=A0A150X1W0_9BACT|nr:ABC transporter permease [Roseivirga echinicomitans]KYG72717.1 hypothetical protein AWN68_08395 [Roseivirga echinicomitans]